jgi:hypothetical protein
MFAIVTFPWPVPSANIDPGAPGRKARRAPATTRTAATARDLSPAGQDGLAGGPEPRRGILTARQA